MRTVCCLILFYLILNISNSIILEKTQECTEDRILFILDINRPGIIPPMRITDEKTGKDPFGVKWNEESGKLSFVGSLQAKEKGESLKHMQLEEKFILNEKDMIFTSTLPENLVDYWKEVLATLFDTEKQVDEVQLSADNKIPPSDKNNKIIINRYQENTLNHGFMINSKICQNIFREAKKLFTKENIDRFYEQHPQLLREAIAIENTLIGKKFNALFNGNSLFKMEIKRNDLLYNPNLLKRMITYFEADIFKSKKLRAYDEETVLNIRRKIIEKFDLQGGLDRLISQSFMKYIINEYLNESVNMTTDVNQSSTKYFSITTTDINMIAFRKTWNEIFPFKKLRLKYPRFGTSYILAFKGNSQRINSVHIYEDHMLRGNIDYEEFIEKFSIKPEVEHSIFHKFCPL